MASTACFLHHHAAITSPAAARTSSNRYVPSLKPSVLVCRAQKQAEAQEPDGGSAVVSRRLALTVLIGAAAVGSKVSPADAAYGESAETNTEFKIYTGDGFKLSVPSKWNPSNEVEFPGQVLRYEDNFDATSNLSVTITPTDKKSITDYGSPEDFLSKGGFDSGAVATANILETATPVVNGTQYYFLSVLTKRPTETKVANTS
ncbi:hypothetical protein DH2020_022945 [Rehmannia glutinosa]|uniref:23 kDa subunit of oxygen evolving system of photosystem II n=1 Tax=Rehmannia glutinosa TaxID=99300 RepID=A0ABR0W5H3_REHGL